VNAPPTQLASVRAVIAADGVLMLQDPALPSLARMVAGDIVRGSWWSHPSGKAIFAIASALDDDDDVVSMKLVAGKVTFVHRRLWSAVVAIGGARAPWQLDGLSSAATELLARVDAEHELEAGGDDAKQLGARLLVHATQRHTDAGHHVGVLQAWARFGELHRVGTPLPDPATARDELEHTVARWAGSELGRATLPWQTGMRRAIKRR